MKQLATLAVVSVVLINLAGSVGAQSGRALTIEDYYKIKSVGDSQISPDGKWVAFTLSTRVEEDNTTAIETFVVPADDPGGVTRLAAFAVAPGVTSELILAALRQRIDPAFLPRPLCIVESLPRNETGKLPRAQLDMLAAKIG